MKNKVLQEIIEFAQKRLMQEYGYCGVASGDNMAMLNSGKDTDIVINVKEKEE